MWARGGEGATWKIKAAGPRAGRWWGWSPALAAASVAYRLLVAHRLEQTAAPFIGLPAFLAVALPLTRLARATLGIISQGTGSWKWWRLRSAHASFMDRLGPWQKYTGSASCQTLASGCQIVATGATSANSDSNRDLAKP